jgi:hypothetical protein
MAWFGRGDAALVENRSGNYSHEKYSEIYTDTSDIDYYVIRDVLSK